MEMMAILKIASVEEVMEEMKDVMAIFQRKGG